MIFRIDKTKPVEKNKILTYTIKNKDILDAFNKAKEDNKIKTQDLLDQMIRHCLKETGYLK